MNPKAKRILLWALLISLILVCGVTIAYMYRATNAVENKLVPGRVDCEVKEAFDGTSKNSITVENTGNIDAYLRVRLVSYWVDSSDHSVIIPKSSEMPVIRIASGWIAGSDNTYYYIKPVDAGGVTSNLLASPMVLSEEDGCLQVVEVFAEAIQSLPKNSVEEAWHVTIDGDEIVSVP